MSLAESDSSPVYEDPAPLYFDSYAIVGPHGKKDARELWRTEDVLSEMEHCGIHGALVTHGLAREYDPAYGNRLLMEELKKSERLFGCWVLLPDHLGEMAAPAELVREMRTEGIVAGKLHPNTHRFALDERTCGKLLDTLEGEGLPLLLDSDEVGLSTIAEICERHPRLAVLLQRFRHGQERLLYPLLDACENLYVEFSTFQSNNVIEMLVARYGPERLLFGTESPIKSPGAAKAMIDYASIGDDARRQIAGGNLARLLGVAPSRDRISLDSGDRVLAAVRSGRPVTELIPEADIIDAHAHPVHDGGKGVGYRPQPGGDIEGMLKIYDGMGVGTTCVASWLGIFGDSERGSDVTAAAIQSHPDRVIGYATVDPSYVEDVAAEVERVYRPPGMLGVKPYFPRNGVSYADPRYRPWWEYANAHHGFALVHPPQLLQGNPRGRPGPDFHPQLRNLSRDYPEVSFILAHTASSFETIRDFAAFTDLPNVFFEITLTSVPLGSIEFLAEKVGAGRVIFGTDCPMRDARPQFGWMAYAHLSESDKLKILGANMRRIIDRCI
jgi:predicted TIM-barrel fold metal-dependent hydrolase